MNRPGSKRPEVVRELLATKAAIKKLAGRKIAVEDAQQLVDNRYAILSNKGRARRARLKLRARRLMVGKTNDGRTLTLVIERTNDPTTWLIVTGWTATDSQRRMLKDQP